MRARTIGTVTWNARRDVAAQARRIGMRRTLASRTSLVFPISSVKLETPVSVRIWLCTGARKPSCWTPSESAPKSMPSGSGVPSAMPGLTGFGVPKRLV